MNVPLINYRFLPIPGLLELLRAMKDNERFSQMEKDEFVQFLCPKI